MKAPGTSFAIAALSVSFALLALRPAFAEDERFDIQRFEIKGNTLLAPAEVERIVAPLTGAGRVYGDIQKALEHLESAYRAAGYSTVQVYVPEQELTSGVVVIEVTENVIGQVVISGQQYFDEENILAALPSLKVGAVPSLVALSEAIQLSNDNPAKQVEVTLASAEEEGKVDARVKVTDSNPQKFFLTLDNTGSAATGKWRIGGSYQHANLFNRDQVATVSYATSPDSPSGVDVSLFSIGYRAPIYAFGDSIDLIFGKSSVNTPSVTPTLGGMLGIVGKGDVYGLRWNHYFPRRGEYTDRLVAALDYKYTDARCSNGGVPVSTAGPTPPIASCVPYTTRPLSLTYVGQRMRPGQAIDYSAGLAYNLPVGARYTNLDGRTDRYSYLTPGNRTTRDDFTVLRMGASIQQAIERDWQFRLAASAQFSLDPLVNAEQIGLAGSTAVRGFNERAVASDGGIVVNAEVYSPELGATLGTAGNLRGLAFIDAARGVNRRAAGTAVFDSANISSTGFGFRYNLGRDFVAKTDFARVLNAGPALNDRRGDWRVHVSMMLSL